MSSGPPTAVACRRASASKRLKPLGQQRADGDAVQPARGSTGAPRDLQARTRGSARRRAGLAEDRGRGLRAPRVAHARRRLQDRAAPARPHHCSLSSSSTLRAGQRHRHQRGAERLRRERAAVGDRRPPGARGGPRRGSRTPPRRRSPAAARRPPGCPSRRSPESSAVRLAVARQPADHALAQRVGEAARSARSARVMSGARITSWPTTQLSARARTTSLRRRLIVSVDARDQPAERAGAGHAPAVDHAVVGRVRVAGEEHVDLARRAAHDVLERPGQARAVVGRARGGPGRRPRAAARRSPAPCAAAARGRSGWRSPPRRRSAARPRPTAARQLGRPLERHADEADPDAADAADHVRREERPAGAPARSRWRPGTRKSRAARTACRRAQPSLGWQPPRWSRSSSAAPSSNSWLPTALTSSPISFSASIVGSSWNSDDSSGLAPTRSPAATTSVLRVAALEQPDVRRQVLGAAGGHAVAAAQRAATDPPGVSASRWPWKSLIPSSWTSTCVRRPLALLLLRVRGRSRHEGGQRARGPGSGALRPTTAERGRRCGGYRVKSPVSCGPTQATEEVSEMPRATSATWSKVARSSAAIASSGSMSCPNTTDWDAA